MNKKIVVAISVLLVAIIFLGAISETVFYYNSKISDLNSQISKLNDIIASFPTAHLIPSFGVVEILGNDSNAMGKPTPIPYNYLYITGSVNNTGLGTAYNVGLLILAYDASGILKINMTVPLGGGIFGSDNSTDTYVLEHYGSYNPTLGVYTSNFSSALGIVDGKQIVYVGGSPPFYGPLSILHEGVVTNWTVTPVWTNLP